MTDSDDASACWILVVDDTEVNRTLTARQLRKLGVTVDLAESGAAALALGAQRRYALVLVDRRMPEMDGFEFAARLRRLEAGADRRTPIVMMTAEPPSAPELERFGRDLDGLLVKPVGLVELGAMLADHGVGAGAPVALDRKPVQGAAAPIDLAELARLMGGDDAAMLCRIVGQFCRAFQAVQDRLETALAERDRVALAEIAHGGKGAAATAAATALAGHMAALMGLAPAAGWSEIERAVGQCRAEFAAVRRSVETRADPALHNDQNGQQRMKVENP